MSNYLEALEVFGFDKVEPALLAALVTEDLLLLIGRSGTGKTFLLNSLSEEMGLEHIKSSLLGSDDGIIRCPLKIRLGLRFVDTHPVNCLEAMLRDEGFRDPEELRKKYELPEGKLVCMPCLGTKHLINVFRSSPKEVLGQALMLGLCTAQLFDQGRPVLWTETSLTRSVELYDPRGFYA